MFVRLSPPINESNDDRQPTVSGWQILRNARWTLQNVNPRMSYFSYHILYV